MKQVINFLLSALAPFASVPTGWAIYAGVTEIPAFPMPWWVACIGAAAVIATSIAAGLLITDIYTHNQGLKKSELAEFRMPAWLGWAILGGCVLAEIVLSLVIVVIPDLLVFGVLVFPLMTVAGIFAFSVRMNLLERALELAELRQSKPKRTRKPAEGKPQPAPSETEPAKVAFVCRVAGCKAEPFGSQSALNAHQRKHKQIIGYAVSMEPITKEQAK